MQTKVLLFITLSLLTFISTSEHDDNWAVLTTGSSNYYNYRHQSDIFHAYHLLLKQGYNPDHIIVFAYDDIANNKMNPFKGQVFNKKDGYDVYAGVKIDYKEKDVTPQNFLKVITGDKEGMSGIGTGKVLESTSKDNVFIYFSDHGFDNYIAFPNGQLFADELNSALQKMHENNMYNKLVFYLESCHSGSMFYKTLPANINVYATTAAGPDESSYAYYCWEDAQVNGTDIGACLGDEYSIRWMEHVDSLEDLSKVTLQEQFEIVKEMTKKSHVQQYGDIKIAEEPLSNYLSKCTVLDYFLGLFTEKETIPMDTKQYIREDIKEMKLNFLKRRAERTNDVEDYKAYIEEVKMAERSRIIFDIFKKKYNIPDKRESSDIDFDCLRQSLKWYEELCGLDIDRDQKYLNYFTTFCTMKLSSWKVYHTFNDICSKL